MNQLGLCIIVIPIAFIGAQIYNLNVKGKVPSLFFY